MVLSNAKIPFIFKEKVLLYTLISFIILLIFAVNLFVNFWYIWKNFIGDFSINFCDKICIGLFARTKDDTPLDYVIHEECYSHWFLFNFADFCSNSCIDFCIKFIGNFNIICKEFIRNFLVENGNNYIEIKN
jgi:hypothetical protein